MNNHSFYETLIEFTERSGASRAIIIPSSDIVIDDRLAGLCKEPTCENYGLSGRCPPYVSGPEGFRKKVKDYGKALFFKIDVPYDILVSNERREFFQLLHEIASGAEKFALKEGVKKAKAFAGGACKKIFCYEHPECAVLSGKDTCRHPEIPRQSMSGFGINVASLLKTAGWDKDGLGSAEEDGAEMSYICGLVLLEI